MKKKSKLMLVVWKWKHSQVNQEQKMKDGLNWDVLPVENQSSDLLIRYDPSNIEELFDFLVANEFKEKYFATHHIQVLLHTSHGYVKGKHNIKVEQLLTYEGQIRGNCHCFGNKGDHLYIQSSSPFGLLGVDGNMGGEFDSIGLIDPLKIDSDGRLFIKPTHFNSTWDYYYYQIKRKTFELNQEITKHFFSFYHSNHSFTLQTPTYLQNKINKFIQLISGVPDEQGFQFPLLLDMPDIQAQSYYQKDTPAKFLDLKEKLEQLNNGSFLATELKALNSAFIQLLNAMPEKTYA